MIKYRFLRILFLSLILGFAGCKSIEIPSFTSQKAPKAPEYSMTSSWAVIPSTYPENLKHWQTTSDLKADVFYIYPTLNVEKKDLRWNMPINDKVQYDKIINKAVYFQASAFINAGQLYVPIYRQAHLRSYSQYQSGGKQALDLAYADVKKAFQYYLKNYNKGRPIIIASHSQGTTHAIRLLQEFFDGKALQNKLIAAYLPGIAIRSDTFKQLKFMTKPDETGGFVTWNTYKKNYYPSTFNKWFKGAYVSNPITWDNKISSSREDHKGFFFTNNKIYKQALQVFVKKGILWTSLPHFPYRIFALSKKRYHAGDINLFWENIRENAVLRVKSYLENN
jgi:hypothetical protein